jgi:hypothetical protein
MKRHTIAACVVLGAFVSSAEAASLGTMQSNAQPGITTLKMPTMIGTLPKSSVISPLPGPVAKPPVVVSPSPIGIAPSPVTGPKGPVLISCTIGKGCSVTPFTPVNPITPPIPVQRHWEFTPGSLAPSDFGITTAPRSAVDLFAEPFTKY